MKNVSVSFPVYRTYFSGFCCMLWPVPVCYVEGVVVMIRLYLKNYKPAELVQLYNALSLARTMVKADVPTNTAKDLDEVLQYISGYMDAKGDFAK
nr:MAG TPA: hypothetical protein [Caudoviricetes sp.]